MLSYRGKLSLFWLIALAEGTATAAAAPFTPDAFTDTDDGRGVTWGLCHFINAGT